MENDTVIKKVLFAFLSAFFVMSAVPAAVSAVSLEEPSELTISEEFTVVDASEDSVQETLQAEYDKASKTLVLQSDLTLEARLLISPQKALTIDLNGHTITGKSIQIDNNAKAPVTFAGEGTIKDCTITKYGSGKLTLDGDIEYDSSDSYALFVQEGQTVIRRGDFYAAAGQYILWADFDWERGRSCLYIKGGNFNGNILLSNSETVIYKGNINGNVTVCGKLTVKGGVLKQGITTYQGTEDETSRITITGGKILDQILIDDGYGSELTISGGVIQSGKEAVIEAKVSESDSISHADITVTGGKIISTCRNGYGIRAVNSEIAFKGGSITSKTKKGAIGIYSIRYNANRKNVKLSKAQKALIKGFGTTVKNDYRKNHCGADVTYKLDKNGTLTISGTGDMFADADFYTIDNGAFCAKIKKLVVQEGVTSVGGFYSCENLQSVRLPSSVKTINRNAFASCRALKELQLKDGLESIGEYAFMYAGSLKNLLLPDTVTTIGKQAFYGCSSLQSVHLPDNLTTLSDSSFAYCKSLKSVEIPEGVTHIYYGTFYGCTKLERVKLPSTLEYIDAVAFISCVKLKELELPANLKEIGRSAFKNCRGIKTIELPSSIVEIDKIAFKNCESLETVIMDNVSKDAKISKSAFDNTPYKRNRQK